MSDITIQRLEAERDDFKRCSDAYHREIIDCCELAGVDYRTASLRDALSKITNSAKRNHELREAAVKRAIDLRYQRDLAVIGEQRLRASIKRGGLDLCPCRMCGFTVACIPDGLPYCDECAKKL